MMMSQSQFLDVIDRDEAERRFHAALPLAPLGVEKVALEGALERVLAEDVIAPVDVPSFDRSNYDGYAVQASDTYGATEEEPRQLTLLAEVVPTGRVPRDQVKPGTAMAIDTGGVLPRGADAVVMVEHTESEAAVLRVSRAVTPGFGIASAGSDIMAGETVLRRGQLLSSRETGMLAAIGMSDVPVWRQPAVAVISTGNEIIAPGAAMAPGLVYDCNAQILADAIRELGGRPNLLGIVRDDSEQLRARLLEALEQNDVVLLSGGTSKGGGDLSYRVVREHCDPGIVAHGVALKPGKPVCLAVDHGKPVVILPGFPTSAIFTFHEFVAPVIRALGGRTVFHRSSVEAKLAIKVNSAIGRTEYLLVGLVQGEDDLAAYPMDKSSGSITAFGRADGFVTIGRHEEIVEAGTKVDVQLLAAHVPLADLIVIGSHCVGLDYLIGQLQEQGFAAKLLAVGSTGGLQAAQRGECDLAGMHLLDADSGEYNLPLITPELELVEGYGRLQGVLFRPDDARFQVADASEAIGRARDDPDCVMVNRNQGSGTRILIDRLLAGAQPPGYSMQTRSHNAVAAAVAQGRADWGVAIAWVARHNGLGFLPLEEERYDFVIPKTRLDRPAVVAFRKLLSDPAIRGHLAEMGFNVATRF